MMYYIYIVYALVNLANGHGYIGDWSEEAQYSASAIIGFIAMLPDDIKATKSQILLTNASIPDDMRTNKAGTFKLVMQEEFDHMESETADAYRTGLIDFDSKRCIWKSLNDEYEAQINDDEVNNICAGDKYHLILTSMYSDLENIEEAAKNMLTEFLKAAQWCSTNNVDELKCYDAIRRQVISNSSRIVAIIERAEKIESGIVNVFKIAKDHCLNRLIENLDAFDAHVKQTFENCLGSS